MSRRLALLTSGGDAPGMNGAIRSVVRCAIVHGWSVWGITRGYQGLIEGDFFEMNGRSVSNIIQKGGTILRTSRCPAFLEQSGRLQAVEMLKKWEIEALLLLGGEGTFKGGSALAALWPGKIVGIPSTIDNDVYGTDFTIGYDTAVNTVVQAIDKVRDTADSHERTFMIEVMGRHCGAIAIEVAIAGGAEEMLIPEKEEPLQAVADRLIARKALGKSSSLIIVAEGYGGGGALAVAEKLRQEHAIESRVVILGYLQRGGSPTARDRVLASQLGAFAVEVADRASSPLMVGWQAGQLTTIPLEASWQNRQKLDAYLLQIASCLAT